MRSSRTDCKKFTTYLSSEHINGYWEIAEQDSHQLFSQITTNIVVNHPSFTPTKKEFKPIPKIQVPLQQIPSKKEDLKILYMYPFFLPDSLLQILKKVAQDLGLDVTFSLDNNHSLNDVVLPNLGSYDIIIAPRTFSGVAIDMGIEATEQCKASGKILSMIMSYESLNRYDRATQISTLFFIDYAFNGAISSQNKKLSIYMDSVLPYSNCYESEENKESREVKALLCTAIYLHSRGLFNLNKKGLEIIDLPSNIRLDETFSDLMEQREIIIKKDIFQQEQINHIDEIRALVIEYLNFQSQGLTQELNGFTITEEAQQIKISRISNGRTICIVTIPSTRSNSPETYSSFSIQLLNEKRKLSSPVKLAFYTSNHDGEKNIPPRPEDKQLTAFEIMFTQIQNALTPLIKQVKKSHARRRSSATQKKNHSKNLFNKKTVT